MVTRSVDIGHTVSSSLGFGGYVTQQEMELLGPLRSGLHAQNSLEPRCRLLCSCLTITANQTFQDSER